jgi:hypothetical protein
MRSYVMGVEEWRVRSEAEDGRVTELIRRGGILESRNRATSAVWISRETETECAYALEARVEEVRMRGRKGEERDEGLM